MIPKIRLLTDSEGSVGRNIKAGYENTLPTYLLNASLKVLFNIQM